MNRTSYAGVSRIAGEDITSLKRVFDEAKLALSIGRSLNIQGELFVHYDELGIYRLIANVTPVDDLWKFYDETVGMIADYDEKHHMDLVRSLEVFFIHNESLSSASEDLYIHVNTLKYRLQKISSLTGQNIQTSEGKLNLQMGLRISYFIHQAHRIR